MKSFKKLFIIALCAFGIQKAHALVIGGQDIDPLHLARQLHDHLGALVKAAEDKDMASAAQAVAALAGSLGPVLHHIVAIANQAGVKLPDVDLGDLANIAAKLTPEQKEAVHHLVGTVLQAVKGKEPKDVVAAVKEVAADGKEAIEAAGAVSN